MKEKDDIQRQCYANNDANPNGNVNVMAVTNSNSSAITSFQAQAKKLTGGQVPLK